MDSDGRWTLGAALVWLVRAELACLSIDPGSVGSESARSGWRCTRNSASLLAFSPSHGRARAWPYTLNTVPLEHTLCSTPRCRVDVESSRGAIDIPSRAGRRPRSYALRSPSAALSDNTLPLDRTPRSPRRLPLYTQTCWIYQSDVLRWLRRL